MTPSISLQPEPFDAVREAARLTHGRTDIGAVVSFSSFAEIFSDSGNDSTPM